MKLEELLLSIETRSVPFQGITVSRSTHVLALIKIARLLADQVEGQCRCTYSERDSGHRSDCQVPETLACIDLILAELPAD